MVVISVLHALYNLWFCSSICITLCVLSLIVGELCMHGMPHDTTWWEILKGPPCLWPAACLWKVGIWKLPGSGNKCGWELPITLLGLAVTFHKWALNCQQLQQVTSCCSIYKQVGLVWQWITFQKKRSPNSLGQNFHRRRYSWWWMNGFVLWSTFVQAAQGVCVGFVFSFYSLF